MADSSAHSNVESLPPGLDYATSAGKEGGVREQVDGLVRLITLHIYHTSCDVPAMVDASGGWG